MYDYYKWNLPGQRNQAIMAKLDPWQAPGMLTTLDYTSHFGLLKKGNAYIEDEVLTLHLRQEIIVQLHLVDL